MKQNPSILAWILLIILSLIWGSSFILIKKGLATLQPEVVGSLRILSASVVLIPFALQRLGRVQKKDWKFLLSVGFAGSLIPAFLFAIAQTRISSSVAGVLNALTPLFTVIIGLVLYKRTYHLRVYLGIVVAFLGSVVLILSNARGEITINAFALLVVLATFFYAFNLNLIKERLQSLSSLTITSCSLMLVGPMAALHLFGMTSYLADISANPELWIGTGYIVTLGVLSTAVALIIFNKVVQLTDPVFTSSVTFIIPLVAIGWGIADGEILTLLQIVGILAILVGVGIVNKRKKNR